MKIKIIFIGTIIFLIGCSSASNKTYIQQNNYQIVQMNEQSIPIISGAILWHDFLEKSKWSKNSINTKTADILISKSVCNILNNGEYFLQIITNTSSVRAESQIPVIFKIFEIGNLQNNKYQLYSANKENIIYQHQEIYFKEIPTLIILHKNKEIGRISGLPKSSWEHDILSILYKN